MPYPNTFPLAQFMQVADLLEGKPHPPTPVLLQDAYDCLGFGLATIMPVAAGPGPGPGPAPGPAPTPPGPPSPPPPPTAPGGPPQQVQPGGPGGGPPVPQAKPEMAKGQGNAEGFPSGGDRPMKGPQAGPGTPAPKGPQKGDKPEPQAPPPNQGQPVPGVQPEQPPQAAYGEGSPAQGQQRPKLYQIEEHPGDDASKGQALRAWAMQTGAHLQRTYGGYTSPEVAARQAVVSPSIGAPGPGQSPHQGGVTVQGSGQAGAYSFHVPPWLVPVVITVIQNLLQSAV